MKLDPKYYSLYICYVNNLKAKPHADIFFTSTTVNTLSAHWQNNRRIYFTFPTLILFVL